MFIEALENTLLDAITRDDADYAKTVIELIKKHPKASLFAVDKENNSFLHHALQHSATHVFKIIYSQIKDSEHANQLLSMQNQEGNTPLALAIITNNTECTELVFNHFPLQESISLFFKKNQEGNTVLHLASCKENCDLFTIFLEKIAKANSDEIKTNTTSFFSKPTLVINNKIPLSINQTNNKGNTPLHLAVKAGISSARIADLINEGANFSQNNNKLETPLQRMLKQAIQKPIQHILLEVFPKLKHEKKLELFATCRTLLIADINNETIKSLYFLLAPNLSLLTLAQAHLEFNEKVAVRTGLTLEKLYLDPIPASYRKKVLTEEKRLGIIRKFSPKMSLDLKKEELFVLLHQIEQLLLEAQTKCEQLEEAQKDSDNQLVKVGIVFSSIAGVLCAVGFILGLGLAAFYWYTDKTISGFLHFLVGMGILFATMFVPALTTGAVFGLIWCVYSLMSSTHASLNLNDSQLAELKSLGLDFPEISTSLDQFLELIQANKVNQNEALLCLDKLGETMISLEYAKGCLHQDKVIVEIGEVELSNLEEAAEKNYLLDYVQHGRII